jgi:hypothetical protein
MFPETLPASSGCGRIIPHIALSRARCVPLVSKSTAPCGYERGKLSQLNQKNGKIEIILIISPPIEDR